MNIRKLSRLETYNIIRKWLDRCNSLDRLRFDADYKINYTIDRVGEILPQSLYNLEHKHNGGCIHGYEGRVLLFDTTKSHSPRRLHFFYAENEGGKRIGRCYRNIPAIQYRKELRSDL